DYVRLVTESFSFHPAHVTVDHMTELTPKYTIRVVAQMVGLHEQSLRMYERKGLIQPQRSDGNIRLFSDADVERVRSIKRLVDDLGVNLAGAEVILHMREQMDLMRQELEQLQRLGRQLLKEDS
ncbi:MAG TPA: helix-turn-helix transcriptional regulator, partial [Herpetosiphonaceae bacterium]